MKQNKRETGRRYEEQAAAFLTKSGYEILEQNYRCRRGEIDLICRDENYLIFVEVKYRENEKNGDPAEAVDRRKQKRIVDTAKYYLAAHGLSEDEACRFDVVAVLGGSIRLIRDAFWS